MSSRGSQVVSGSGSSGLSRERLPKRLSLFARLQLFSRWPVAMAALFWLTVPLLASPTPTTGHWTSLIRDYWDRYPEARAQDIYKLVYQGTMEPEHTALDPEAVKGWLLREMQALEPDLNEPLVELIEPKGRLVRINLRPYKALQGSVDSLFRTMIQSIQSVRPLRRDLEQALAELKEADLGTSKRSRDLRQFVRLMSLRGFPSLQHSDAYRQKYRPAYRVILAEFLPLLELALTDVRSDARSSPHSEAP